MTLGLLIESAAATWLSWPLVVAPLFVALCTFVGGLAWAAAVATSRWCRSLADLVVVRMNLAWLEDSSAGMRGKIPEGTRLYCLVVRFGTDEYLANMASEQERHQGRLNNGVIEIGRGERDMILPLRVHRKLGTQFKLYYLVPEGASALELWQALDRAPIKLVSGRAARGHRIVLDGDGPAGGKCWFGLAAYGAHRTIDGFATSYFAASQVPGFERRNRLKQWWWMRTVRQDRAEEPIASAG